MSGLRLHPEELSNLNGGTTTTTGSDPHRTVGESSSSKNRARASCTPTGEQRDGEGGVSLLESSSGSLGASSTVSSNPAGSKLFCLKSTDGVTATTTGCGHVFHVTCLWRWMATRMVATDGRLPDCPVCRATIPARMCQEIMEEALAGSEPSSANEWRARGWIRAYDRRLRGVQQQQRHTSRLHAHVINEDNLGFGECCACWLAVTGISDCCSAVVSHFRIERPCSSFIAGCRSAWTGSSVVPATLHEGASEVTFVHRNERLELERGRAELRLPDADPGRTRTERCCACISRFCSDARSALRSCCEFLEVFVRALTYCAVMVFANPVCMCILFFAAMGGLKQDQHAEQVALIRDRTICLRTFFPHYWPKSEAVTVEYDILSEIDGSSQEPWDRMEGFMKGKISFLVYDPSDEDSVPTRTKWKWNASDSTSDVGPGPAHQRERHLQESDEGLLEDAILEQDIKDDLDLHNRRLKGARRRVVSPVDLMQNGGVYVTNEEAMRNMHPYLRHILELMFSGKGEGDELRPSHALLTCLEDPKLEKIKLLFQNLGYSKNTRLKLGAGVVSRRAVKDDDNHKASSPAEDPHEDDTRDKHKAKSSPTVDPHDVDDQNTVTEIVVDHTREKDGESRDDHVEKRKLGETPVAASDVGRVVEEAEWMEHEREQQEMTPGALITPAPGATAKQAFLRRRF
ncbi:unnamed protein product [Amoebophrya sp. A25]|nr:unnamed protein product [Amoebophrya sp. A25]|eukprot:GSA25T00026881001.1